MRLFVALLLLPALVLATEADPRYCGEPKRDANGTIHRSTSQIYTFRSNHPCPSTGLKFSACPGWAVDHVVSLDCGGCDHHSNMQWLPNDIKSSPNPHAKDRWERKVYANGLGGCKFEVVK